MSRATSGACRRPARAAARSTALAGALALALALTGCGGDGGSSDGGSSDAEPSTASGTAGSGTAGSGSAGSSTAGSDASGSAGAGESGGLEGSWLTKTGGKWVALVVTGDQAGLFVTGGTVCGGTADATKVEVSCTDGDKDRESGTVDSVDGTTLTVTWAGRVGPETYTRAKDGKLPSELTTDTATATAGS